MKQACSIRPATAADVPLMLTLIRELAVYEKLEGEVVATPELLHEWLFEKEKAEVVIAEIDGEAVGWALFFHNFSSFLGRAGIYLEDLYVRPAARGKGTGTALLRYLARLAIQRGCGRLEWCCLDWNKSSVDFYLSLGAKRMEGWTIFRVAGQGLAKLGTGDANQEPGMSPLPPIN